MVHLEWVQQAVRSCSRLVALQPVLYVIAVLSFFADANVVHSLLVIVQQS